MNGLTKAIASCLGLVLLTACGTKLQEAERVSPQGAAFDQNLYDGYMELSRSEFGEGDYRASDDFATSALAAGKGGGVQPVEIGERRVPRDKLDEVSSARLRLMAELAEGAAEKKPIEAAEAQVKFDCWMQELEENRQPEDIANCRDGFMTALAKLEERPVAAAPAPAPQAPPGPWVVNFEFDRSELTPNARAILTDMIEAAKKSGFETISLGGHTDLVGPADYNKELSKKRYRAVADFLIESGIQKEKIVGAGFGPNKPIVNTPKPEERNRRVEINLSR
ncbi:MAG: OmpA family protein [Kiloniellales bacterium]|nr:OmpA family protein [Kiloniellales bacterium]